MGHLSRCVALESQLRLNGWHCTFVGKPETEKYLAKLTEDQGRFIALSSKLEDEPRDLGELAGSNADLLVVDNYVWKGVAFDQCRKWAGTIVAIDDLNTRRRLECDVVINPNANATPSAYDDRIPENSRVLCGTSFALLRPQFRALRSWSLARRAEQRKAASVLVNFGGGLHEEAVVASVASLDQLGFAGTVDVVVPFGNGDVSSLRRQLSGVSLEWWLHDTTTDIAERMADVDLVIGAGGVGAAERMCLGVPGLSLILADNQVGPTEALGRLGATIPVDAIGGVESAELGEAIQKLLVPEIAAEMSGKSAVLCDGLGSSRVIAAGAVDMNSLQDVWLRPAASDDCEVVFLWQSTPGARRYARVSEPPTRQDHSAWFRKRIEMADGFLNIVQHRDVAVGVVRLDRVDACNANQGAETYEVSILIGEAFSKKGIGKAALKRLRQLIPNAHLVAEVHQDNFASQALFEKSGYSRLDPTHFENPPLSSAT